MLWDDEEVLGIVINNTNIGENDRRVVLLTCEKGRITAFAKGARKQNSHLLGSTNTFCFGRFFLKKGKTAYYIDKVDVDTFFDDLRKDFLSAYYGSYFLEYAGYFAPEGVESKNILSLLYMALKALSNKMLDKNLVKMVFEMKMFVYHGEYPEFNNCIYCGAATSNATFSFERDGIICNKCYTQKMMGNDLVYLNPTVIYTLKFIKRTDVKQLFTFKLKGDSNKELERFVEDFKSKHLKHDFKSLKVLNEIIYKN